MVKEKLKPAGKNEEVTSGEKELILFNDDINTFDYVIETLIEVCGHDAYPGRAMCAGSPF